jgi:hypothetical protein
VLDERRAADIVDRIDLRTLPICPLCHLDLAFAVLHGKPRRAIAGLTTSTSSWVWPEIEAELYTQLWQASSDGESWADEAARGPRRARGAEPDRPRDCRARRDCHRR